MNATTDPFSLKSMPKWHVKRAAWTIGARLQEKLAALSFSHAELPMVEPPNLAACPDPEKGETAVTGIQLSYLAAALKSTEPLASTAVVEIGCYRGATTRALASMTRRPYFAVDPYIGYGGCEDDKEAFLKRIAGLANVTHLRQTSGEAARNWKQGGVGFVFIDAVHDFVNTSFDIDVWGRKLVPGGLMALHDTDNALFPGTRKAAFEAAKTMDLWAHTHDLLILKKR